MTEVGKAWHEACRQLDQACVKIEEARDDLYRELQQDQCYRQSYEAQKRNSLAFQIENDKLRAACDEWRKRAEIPDSEQQRIDDLESACESLEEDNKKLQAKANEWVEHCRNAEEERDEARNDVSEIIARLKHFGFTDNDVVGCVSDLCMECSKLRARVAELEEEEMST